MNMYCLCTQTYISAHMHAHTRERKSRQLNNHKREICSCGLLEIGVNIMPVVSFSSILDGSVS